MHTRTTTMTSTRTASTRRTISRAARTLLVVLALPLAACGGDGDAAPAPVRSYEVPLHIDDSGDEYRYLVTGSVPDFTVGDEVTFVVDNTGTLNHDLRVVGPDGTTLGTAAAVAPGDVLELTVLFEQAGIHQLNCVVDDHLLAHGMQEFIDVAPA